MTGYLDAVACSAKALQTGYEGVSKIASVEAWSLLGVFHVSVWKKKKFPSRPQARSGESSFIE